MATTASYQATFAGFAGRGKKRPFYMVGGSWRALARLDMMLVDYPLPITHEYRLEPDRPGREPLPGFLGQSGVDGELRGTLALPSDTVALESITAVYTRLMDDRFLPELKGLPATAPERIACSVSSTLSSEQRSRSSMYRTIRSSGGGWTAVSPGGGQ